MRALLKKGTRAAIAATVAWVLIGGVTTPAHTTTVALDREAGATACADGYHATPWREPILSGGGTLDAGLAAAASRKVLFVGERHAQPAHQSAHLEVVCRLHRSGQEVAIAVEFIQHPFQLYVDDYLAGTIGEVELRRRMDYDRRWGYPFELYAPILRFARDHGLRVLALNVPAELTRKLATVGLDGLTEAEREFLPEGFEDAPRGYGARLIDSHRRASEHHGLSYEGFELAQLAWDEGMAERVAEYVLAEPDATVVVLAGNGHVAWPGGIPDRVRRRAGVRGYVFANLNEAVADASMADRVIQWNDDLWYR